MFLWNLFAERLLFLCTTRSLRPQQDVLSDCTVHKICCSVCQKYFVFSKVCRSLGRHGSEGRHCFQNEGIEECGRSDRVPLRLNKKTPIILLSTRITSFHVYVLERYDICMVRTIPALRVTSNHAYVISL